MSQNINDTNVNEIRNQVTSLLDNLDSIIANNENPTDYDVTLRKRHKKLLNTSKTLFEFIFKNYTKDNFDKTQFHKNLDMMLNAILNIQNSQLTQHEASVSIGKSLATQYIPQYK